MARQPKTSTRNYKRKYDDKHKVKCGICGIPSADVSPSTVRGIVRWICSTCKTFNAKRNGI